MTLRSSAPAKPQQVSWASRFFHNLRLGATILSRRPRRIAGTPIAWPRPGRLMASAFLAIAIMAAVTIWLDVHSIEIARAMPPAVTAFFRIVTDTGKSGWFLWPVGLAVIFIGALSALPSLTPMAHGVLASIAARCGFFFLAVAVPGLFSAIVKRLIGRARPFVGGEADAYLYDPFSWHAAYASLPSGHSTTAFGIAVALGAFFPRARMLWWFYAVLIAVSRVAVWAHHPSDVIAGAIVGSIGAILIRNVFAARRIAFAIDVNGKAYAKPGPSWRRVKNVARQLVAA